MPVYWIPALGRIMDKLIWDSISEDTEDSDAIIMFVGMALLTIGLVGHLIKRNWKAFVHKYTKASFKCF